MEVTEFHRHVHDQEGVALQGGLGECGDGVFVAARELPFPSRVLWRGSCPRGPFDFVNRVVARWPTRLATVVSREDWTWGCSRVARFMK